jgi:hypothetical protein
LAGESLLTGAGTLAGGAGAGSLGLQELLKYGSTASKLIGALGGGSSPTGRSTGSFTGSQGSDMNIWDLINGGMNAGNAAISGGRNEKFADQMMALYNNQLAKYQPMYDKLKQTYDDPMSYLGGPEYQALARVRGNQVNRGDSRTFTNSTDREKLMQDHATASIDKYRQGLQAAMTGTDPSKYAESYARGSDMERQALNPMWAMLGDQGGASGFIQQLLKGLGGGSGGITIEDIFKMGGNLPDIGNISFDDIFKVGRGGEWGDWTGGGDFGGGFDGTSVFAGGGVDEDTFDWFGDIFG